MNWRILSCVLFTACLGFGPRPPAFEVASIKPAAPPSMGKIMVRMNADGGMLRYTNVTLRDCIRTAYRVKEFQIEGPDWIGGARFDIVAKLPDGSSKDQIPEMLQGLLAERFKLALHRDTKEHPIYSLVTARGGAKLKTPEVATADAATALDKPEKDGPPRGAVMMRMDPGGAHLKASSTTLGDLAEMISRFVERPVVDMTGIEGQYDFDLVFSPETMRGMRGMPGPMPPPPGAGDHASGNATSTPAEGAVSIFESVQRYGLKLEPRKAPVELLIIDHVEKTPTEN